MYTTIDSENQKNYRKAMEVVVTLENPADTDYLDYYPYTFITSGLASGMWGGEDYVPNARATRACKSMPILMDFAGGGFYNDGNAIPITKEELGGGSGYGFIAKTITTSYIGVQVKTDSTSAIIRSGTYVRACVRDSKGNAYYINKKILSSDSDYFDWYYYWYIRRNDLLAMGFPSDERMYLEYAFCGDIIRFSNNELIDCTVNLRGVETKLADPSLQMSEIEFNAYCPKRKISVNKLQKGSRIRYTAGYFGDMSYPRFFYVNDRVTQDKRGTIHATGYDSTAFLDFNLAGIATTYYSSDANFHAYGHDLAEDFIAPQIKKPNTLRIYDDVQGGGESNTAPGAYKNTSYLYQNVNLREIIANTCNVFRAKAKSYLNKGLYIDYVDAGCPVMRLSNSLYTNSVYEDAAADDNNLGKGTREIKNWQMTDFDISYDDVYKTYKLPNYYVIPTNMKRLDEADIELEPGESKVFESDKPVYYWYATVDNEEVSDAFEEKGVYYAILKNNTSSTKTYHVWWWLYSIAHSAKSPFIKRRKYGSGTHVFPIVYGLMNAYQTSAKTTYASLFSSAIDNIVSRSEITWSFTWRGDPRMQPRDRVEVETTVAGGETQLLTIDTITLEHSAGGLTSEIVGRLGEV